jgi:hypothetical protein
MKCSLPLRRRVPFSVFIVFLAVASLAYTRCLNVPTTPERYPIKRAPVGFINPADNGGSQLDSSGGLGEPLNASSLISKRTSHT